MTRPSLPQLVELATRQTEAGQFDAARGNWLAALSLQPDSGEVMLELSYLESLAGRHRAGHDWCMRAAHHPPVQPQAQVSFIRRLRTFNLLPQLRAFAESLITQAQATPGVLLECSRQLSNLNESSLALRCAQRARELAPGDPGARLQHAHLQANSGESEAAEAELERILGPYPQYAIGWWMLARLRRQTSTRNHVPQLRSLLARSGLRPIDVAALARALHKELDDLGDHEGAWNALERMCHARRGALHHDRQQTRSLVDRLIALPGNAPVAPVPDGPVPIFIVGMHRSGTTLLEQLLDVHPAVRSLGELMDFTCAMRHAADHYCKGVIDETLVARAAQVDFAEVGKRYLNGIACRLEGESFFTDKEPANFLNIDFICMALPHARILHMLRDPIETCFSNLRELFSEINPWSWDQHELADHFLQYRRLMAHWHQRWPGRILDVPYAELTRDAEAVMRRVADFCGLDYRPGMDDPRNSPRAVSTASAIQVREGVVRREVPKWLPYRRQLGPLIDALSRGGIEIEPAG